MSSSSSSPPIPQEKSDPEKIKIRFVGGDGRETHIVATPTTPFKKLANAYALKLGVPEGSLRFLNNGERIPMEKTLGTLGIENDDIIDVMLQQTGGKDGVQHIPIHFFENTATFSFLPEIDPSHSSFFENNNNQLHDDNEEEHFHEEINEWTDPDSYELEKMKEIIHQTLTDPVVIEFFSNPENYLTTNEQKQILFDILNGDYDALYENYIDATPS